MSAYGAVGRFAVAGWRRDILLAALVPASPALTLDAVAFEPGTGVAANLGTSDLILAEVAWQPSAGVVFDLVPGDALAISELALGASGGASAPLVPDLPLVLETVEFDVPAGNSISVVPSPLVLAEAVLQALAGVRLETSAGGDLDLTGAVLFAGSGTASPLVPAETIVLNEAATSAQAGARVDYRHGVRNYYPTAVAAWAVAGGPIVRRPQALESRGVAFQVLAGATQDLGTSDLVLDTVAYEVGARRKAVRGQTLIY